MASCSVFTTELLLSKARNGDNLLHLAAEKPLLEHAKIILNTLDKTMAHRLASSENNDGKKPSEISKTPAISQLIEDALIPASNTFTTDAPPTVLIFYSTVDREEYEEEMNTLCQMFTKSRIFPRVYQDATSEQLEMEIKWATERADLSSLLVTVLSHGSKGCVKLRDKTVEISSIVSIMSAAPLANKPKVSK